MIDRLVLFGASGDLSGRFLLPGLAALLDQGDLPEPFIIVGAAGREWDNDGFRAFATEKLDEHAAHLPSAVREGLLKSLRYQIADVTDPVAAEAALRVAGDSEAVAVYLALPQHLYSGAIDALVRAGLPPGGRVVLEKPFGEDRQSAQALNSQIQGSVPGGEAGVYRVDHVLGMATTQNLLALRATDRMLDAVWSGEHIEEVSIHWEETLALEGRAGFYDHAGALKDVLQNHMLQVLALVAMEPPTSLDAHEIRARKLDALRAVQSVDVDHMSRRARYTAGRLTGTGGAGDRDVPSYVDEDGVEPSRETETFVELLLELNMPRWVGTRFRMRAGKALRDRRKGVLVRLRSSHTGADEFWVGLDGPENLALRLHGTAAVQLTSPPIRSDRPAYASVLLDVLEGGSGLSVSGAEAEEAWRIVDPVLAGWRQGRVPMAEYPAGSEGPQRL